MLRQGAVKATRSKPPIWNLKFVTSKTRIREHPYTCSTVNLILFLKMVQNGQLASESQGNLFLFLFYLLIQGEESVQTRVIFSYRTMTD
jgi:hypothetical protein